MVAEFNGFTVLAQHLLDENDDAIEGADFLDGRVTTLDGRDHFSIIGIKSARMKR